MHSAPDQDLAFERVRWLDELKVAISEAKKLAWQLGVADGASEEARQLYARLDTVRCEVESLRFGDWAAVRKEIDPKWIESLLNGCSPISNNFDE